MNKQNDNAKVIIMQYARLTQYNTVCQVRTSKNCFYYVSATG